MNALMTLLLAVNVSAQAPAAATPDGAKIFAAKCTPCHAKDAKGNPGMVKMFKLKDISVINLTAEATAKKKDADLTEVLLAGRNKMPAFKGKLTDEEISAVIGYIRSLAPAPKAAAVEKKKDTK